MHKQVHPPRAFEETSSLRREAWQRVSSSTRPCRLMTWRCAPLDARRWRFRLGVSVVGDASLLVPLGRDSRVHRKPSATASLGHPGVEMVVHCKRLKRFFLWRPTSWCCEKSYACHTQKTHVGTCTDTQTGTERRGRSPSKTPIAL